DPDPPRPRQLAQQRKQETSRSGAEVEQPERDGTVEHPRQHGGDQRLAIGPRVERGGGESERQAPELPLAENPRYRLAREPAIERRGEMPCRPVLAWRSRIAEQTARRRLDLRGE